ncbi:MAG: hypothetical protein IK088_00600, partial [Lachnospiraceae bacterium]|nr:hypothetical protein [Lachnospiraceae bacterium]
MKAKGKRILSVTGAILLAVLVFFIGSEAVGKYRAGTMKEVSGVRVRIKTLTIPVPESPGDFIFSGTTVSPAFAVPFGASLSGETEGVHAGTYTVVCSLEDPDHSVWPDGTTGDKEITWRILPLVVPKPELIDGKCAYSGEAEEPTYGPVSPYVVTTGQLSAVLPGDYRMGVQLRDDLDYAWEDGTTAPVFFDWQIGVCRIGSILYPSVTAAFQTDRSTEEMPVEMITNWAEEAENTGGNDWLSLNGFTLSSGGVTITNEAQLTILGYGTVSAASETASELSAVKNSGSLAIRGGTFNLSYEGDGTSTDQVEIFKSTGGETVISGGTFTGNGGEAQIAAIRSAG